MENSILISTKKHLNLPPDYDAFDLDIIVLINSAFSTLAQIGIGPATGFMIEDDKALWGDFTGGDPLLNSVRTYVHLKSRLVFDPPANPSVITAIKDTIQEIEYRLSVTRESTQWVAPNPVEVFGDDGQVRIIDGGTGY